MNCADKQRAARGRGAMKAGTISGNTGIGTELRVGCKINLTLRITGVRPNGWHELDTVFVPLPEPHDTLRLVPDEGSGLTLRCDTPGIDCADNTLTKAYRLFAEATGFRPGVEARLVKGIPHGAGLGGGSADAAALLGWLNGRAPDPLSPDTLASLAVQRSLPGDRHRGPAGSLSRMARGGGRRRSRSRAAVPRRTRLHAVGLRGLGQEQPIDRRAQWSYNPCLSEPFRRDVLHSLA